MTAKTARDLLCSKDLIGFMRSPKDGGQVLQRASSVKVTEVEPPGPAGPTKAASPKGLADKSGA